MELTDKHIYILESFKISKNKLVGINKEYVHYNYIEDLFKIGYIKLYYNKNIYNMHTNSSIVYNYYRITDEKIKFLKNRNQLISKLFTTDDNEILVKNNKIVNIFKLNTFATDVYVNGKLVDAYVKPVRTFNPSGIKIFIRYEGYWYSFFLPYYYINISILDEQPKSKLQLYTYTKLKRTRLEKLNQIIDI